MHIVRPSEVYRKISTLQLNLFLTSDLKRFKSPRRETGPGLKYTTMLHCLIMLKSGQLV